MNVPTQLSEHPGALLFSSWGRQKKATRGAAPDPAGGATLPRAPGIRGSAVLAAWGLILETLKTSALSASWPRLPCPSGQRVNRSEAGSRTGQPRTHVLGRGMGGSGGRGKALLTKRGSPCPPTDTPRKRQQKPPGALPRAPGIRGARCWRHGVFFFRQPPSCRKGFFPSMKEHARRHAWMP